MAGGRVSEIAVVYIYIHIYINKNTGPAKKFEGPVNNKYYYS